MKNIYRQRYVNFLTMGKSENKKTDSEDALDKNEDLKHELDKLIDENKSLSDAYIKIINEMEKRLNTKTSTNLKNK